MEGAALSRSQLESILRVEDGQKRSLMMMPRAWDGNQRAGVTILSGDSMPGLRASKHSGAEVNFPLTDFLYSLRRHESRVIFLSCNSRGYFALHRHLLNNVSKNSSSSNKKFYKGRG